MAVRPFAFGLRLRDGDRTVRVRLDGDRSRYVVEETRIGKPTKRRKHASAKGAVKDAAQTWRSRLH